MRYTSPWSPRLIIWLLLCVCLLVPLPQAARAQDPPNATPEPTSEQTDLHDFVPVDPNAPTPAPLAPAADSPALETSAAPYAPAQNLQGDIKVDVAATDKLRAGDVVLYTYSYTNTRSSAADIVLNLSWGDFNSLTGQANQSCTVAPDPNPGCDPFAAIGPAVTKVATTTPNICATTKATDPLCYTLSLAAGQAGKFSVRIITRRTLFPVSDQSIYRPSGSVRLFVGGTRISEDTATALIVGPALVLTKTPVEATKKLFPVKSISPRPADSEIGEFSLVVGNATGKNDKPGGNIRADATDATAIVIVDSFPAGGDFIDATGSPVVDAAKKTVTWTIPGPLKPGATLPEVRVKYAKLDVNLECGKLNNNVLNVSSAEFPLGTTGSPPARLSVAGKAATYDVVTPLMLASVKASPPSAIFGDSAEITIVVQSYWTQPISGMRLDYSVQSNAAYVANSAKPATTTVTAGANPVLSWTFDLPAATNRTTAQTKEFKLTVQGGYSTVVTLGLAQLIAPSSVPSACVKTTNGVVGLTPRLTVTKTILDALPNLGNVYYTTQQTPVRYQIEVTNKGNAAASNVTVIDALPNDVQANFSYKEGSATLDGSPITPLVTNGKGGTLVWNNLTVPARTDVPGKATLVFTLIVDGADYVKYCNNARATTNESESIMLPPAVCVKFQPNITITKTVNGSAKTITAQAGDIVTFLLTMKNNESTPFEFGLYDKMGLFTFKAMKSGYDMNPVFDGVNVKWALVTLAPGEQKSVEFTAQVPTKCSTGEYTNEAQFYNTTVGNIQPIPPITVGVRVGCGIEYGASTSTAQASLDDKLVYTLNVNNKNIVEVKSVVVTNTLPLGFAFVGMEASSTVTTAPQTKTLPDGRIQQRWTISSIGASKSQQIKINVRSSSVIGKWYNVMVVEGGSCTGNCQTDPVEGASSGAPVNVAPLITAEPRLTPTTCAKPNDTPIYQLSIVNTNTHAYANTTITVSLPLGLSFVTPITNTATPSVSTLSNGSTQVVWQKLSVPAKGTAFGQLVLAMRLKVGNVLGNLSALVQTASSDGGIPRKEGVVDPTISICLPGPALAKIANKTGVQANEEIIYDITLASPKTVTVTATIEDQLPAGMTYVGMVDSAASAPQVSGTKLTWSNVQIPPATGTLIGEVHLKFKVKMPNDKSSKTYKNTATVVQSSEALDISRASSTVTTVRFLYLPIARKVK